MTEPRIRTTTVLPALLDVHQRLISIEYPTSSDTGKAPGVFFLGYWTELTAEYVHLVGKVDDNDLVHSGSGPSTREETYVLRIRCGTTVRGKNGPQVIERLAEITDTVEAAFRDATTGQPVPPDVSGVIVRGGLERFEVDGGLTDAGAEAFADLYIRVYARI